MSVTVRTLLEDALYLSSIADREFSPTEPDGSQINVAMNVLRRVIDQYRYYIPYETQRELNGNSELENIDAASINFVDYLNGTSVVNLERVTQRQFSDYATVVNLKGIPQMYWHDEANNAIRVYPIASQDTNNYVIGYKPLVTFTSLDQAVPSSVTPFMEEFLVCDVARKLCTQYRIMETADLKERYVEAKRNLVGNSRLLKGPKGKIQLGKGRQPPVPYLAYMDGIVPR